MTAPIVKGTVEFERSRTSARVILVGLIIGLMIYNEALDSSTSALWKSLRENPLFAHDSFEPLLASASFSLWLWFYYYVDKFQLMEMYRIRVDTPHDTRWNWKSVKALLAYLLPLLVFDIIVPRRRLSADCPGFFAVVGKVCQTIFVYDFIFFFIHLGLHKLRILHALGHQKHHEKAVLSSIEVINHSFIDGSLQVASNIVALKLCKAHPLSRALHNIIITYLLTELHAGYDAPWMLHNLLPFRILGGPPAHEIHHRSGTRNFQQFFTYLDAAYDYWTTKSQVIH